MPAASAAPSWIEIALLLLSAGTIGIGIALLAALRRLERRTAALDRLQGLEAALQKLAERESALDLRRTEHGLFDVRDAVRRLEDRMMATAESRAKDSAALPAVVGSGIADRVITRLVALGYERIRIVTASAELDALVAGEGSVVVEARRDGAPCKGRVHVARGLVGELEIQPAYSAFP